MPSASINSDHHHHAQRRRRFPGTQNNLQGTVFSLGTIYWLSGWMERVERFAYYGVRVISPLFFVAALVTASCLYPSTGLILHALFFCMMLVFALTGKSSPVTR